MNVINNYVNQIIFDDNVVPGYNFSGRQMYWMAVENLNAPNLDIKKVVDYNWAYEFATKDVLLGFYFLAVLQNRLAHCLKHGRNDSKDALDLLVSTHTVYEGKLRDKVKAELAGVPVRHDWLQ